MKTTAATEVLTVTATDPDSRNLELDAAVAAMEKQAILDGYRGILVRRHTPQNFTVELSDEVPFGLTREQDVSS
ncbi:hypothetical protein [Arthrobacter sp. D3-16]